MLNLFDFVCIFFKGLTFKTLDPCVDFYFFTLTSFYNECTENTRKGGVFLIDGSAELTFVKH